MNSVKNSTNALTLLSELLFGEAKINLAEVEAKFETSNRDELWQLANSHHVILRTFPHLSNALAA